MVHTRQDQSGLQELIPQLGGMLGKVLQQRGQNQRQQQSANLIQEAIAQSEIDPNTGAPNIESLMGNIYGAIQEGANPEMAASFLKNYGDISKNRGTNLLQQQKELSAIETAKQSRQHEKIISERFKKLRENYSEVDLKESVSDLIDEGIPYETIKKQLEEFKIPELGKLEKKQIFALKTAKRTLVRMKDLVTKGTAGTTIGVPLAPTHLFGQRAKDRAKLEKAGQSLIPIVSAGVTIRTQKEFDEYKSIITNPNSRVPALLGAIEGLDEMIDDQMDILRPVTREKKAEDLSRFKKVKKGTVLKKRSIVLKLLEESDNDPVKAQELARKLGYMVEKK